MVLTNPKRGNISNELCDLSVASRSHVPKPKAEANN